MKNSGANQLLLRLDLFSFFRVTKRLVELEGGWRTCIRIQARLTSALKLLTIMASYGKKHWIVGMAVLVGCVLLALLRTFYADDGLSTSFFNRVVQAASCSSAYRDLQDSSSSKIVFKYHFANRVFTTLRADNTFTIDIYCLTQVLLIIFLTVVVIGFLQLSLVAIYVLKVYLHKPISNGSAEVEDAEANFSTSSNYLQDCIPYSYKDLAHAANGFTKEIGRGSFGVVYSGKLIHEGEQKDVAIKRMIWKGRRIRDPVFEGEIKRIGMLRHKNVLQLLGYSDTTEKDKPLLMVTPLHSSLAKHLEDDSLPWLNWAARFRIAVGVAEGLAYLHEGAQQRLVHHDIKPGNILFNKETFQAYIADFGSSRLMEPMRDEMETKHIIGTSGYMDPHFREHKKRTTKVDVYSFGVVLFVLVAGGKQSTKVSDLVDRAVDTDVIDPDFSQHDASSYKHDEVIRTLQVARLCTKYEPELRPTMSEVVMMLRGDIPVSRFAQDLSRAAASVATFAQRGAQAAIFKVKSLVG